MTVTLSSSGTSIFESGVPCYYTTATINGALCRIEVTHNLYNNKYWLFLGSQSTTAFYPDVEVYC